MRTKEELLEYAKEYYQRNKEKVKARRRERYRENYEEERERQRKYSKKYYHANAEASKRKTGEWQRQNKDIVNCKARLRRYQKAGVVELVERETKLLTELLEKKQNKTIIKS